MRRSGPETWIPSLWLAGATVTFLGALAAEAYRCPVLQAAGGTACFVCLVGFFVEAWRDSDR